MAKVKGKNSPVEWNEAEDPLFLIFTSGSTGVPKVNFLVSFFYNFIFRV